MMLRALDRPGFAKTIKFRKSYKKVTIWHFLEVTEKLWVKLQLGGY